MLHTTLSVLQNVKVNVEDAFRVDLYRKYSRLRQLASSVRKWVAMVPRLRLLTVGRMVFSFYLTGLELIYTQNEVPVVSVRPGP